MALDVEKELSRELRGIAEGLQIPALPPLHDPPRLRSRWQPLLVAASVVLILAGGIAVAATTLQGGDPQPAPQPAPSLTPTPTATPTPTPSTSDLPSLIPTEVAAPIPKRQATVPYVLDQRLYVDGEQVPGSWWAVEGTDEAWAGVRSDYTWWFGQGAAASSRLDGLNDTAPVLSPNGDYLAHISTEFRDGIINGFETRVGGEGLGFLDVDLGDRQDGSLTTVRAVTDDGRVIVQGTRTNLLWLPQVVDARPVDLDETAPGQVIRQNTPAGLVVTDGEGGEAYLATISDTGRLTRVASLPAHDDLTASPGGTWLAWVPAGSLGGEVMALATLEIQTVDAAQQATLSAPDGWAFRVHSWTWEDDDYLVAPLVRANGEPGERLARCSAQTAECVLLPK